VLCTGLAAEGAESAEEKEPPNLIPNGDFRKGDLGGLPEGWTVQSARPELAPAFRLIKKESRRLLLATGGGNPDCVGYLTTKAPLTLGKTYRFRVLFRKSVGLNPQQHLLFQSFRPNAQNGIFEFRRRGGWIEGNVKIEYPGEGPAEADIRILFRLSARGKAWIKSISLTETEPVQPRWVKVACTSGTPSLDSDREVLDAAGPAKADLVLLTEYMHGGFLPEPVPGPSSQLMAEKARQYGMYVAGGIVRQDEKSGLLFNTALLFDRQGNLVGQYDKFHPYSPEVNDEGITPGSAVPVFPTDFGKVGIMICYDSWFTDVAQLLALKGAEIILFPNMGCYRSLLPARAADNGVRVVCSSWNSGYGVWDTAGRDVLQPDADPTVQPLLGNTFKDVVEMKVGNVGLLMVTLDLNSSPSPAYNGGTMMSAPGGRRNRGDQKCLLEEEIRKERERWWTEE
jgi:predicted amidohydrolase